ncbi:MAG TPA: cupin domain-containing protein [Burkholderiaceae bacterium]|nr:cupin domain-containing protein [Burkholderiaceae bacterium]
MTEANTHENTERAQRLRERLIRNVETAELHREERTPLYDTRCARLGTGTAARKLGISVDIVAPGKRSCPYHFHYAQEEAFVILEGEGTLRVAGEMLALKAGDTIFIPPGPQYPHQIVNTSTAPLKYLSISTKETPEVVEYPDSDKYLAMASGPLDDAGTLRTFGRMHREQNDLDYWDGEP